VVVVVLVVVVVVVVLLLLVVVLPVLMVVVLLVVVLVLVLVLVLISLHPQSLCGEHSVAVRHDPAAGEGTLICYGALWTPRCHLPCHVTVF